jgi:hypothetical protein
MKTAAIILLFLAISFQLTAQRKLLVEKTGTSRKYYFLEGDVLKLKIRSLDTIVRGKLLDLRDSGLTLSGWRPMDIPLRDIGAVYKAYSFPKKFGVYSIIFGGAIFAVITTNHLINNEQVFTPDLFIISGSFIGAGLVSLSLSQKKCRIGPRWKVKVLNFDFP